MSTPPYGAPLSPTVMEPQVNPLKRIVAGWIDLTLLFLATVPAQLSELTALFSRGPVGAGYFFGWVLTILLVLLYVIILVALMGLRGTSPGALIFGYRVVDADTGDKATFVQAIIRLAVAGALSIVCVGVGPIILAITIVLAQDGRGLHDRAARTTVANGRSASSGSSSASAASAAPVPSAAPASSAVPAATAAPVASPYAHGSAPSPYAPASAPSPYAAPSAAPSAEVPAPDGAYAAPQWGTVPAASGPAPQQAEAPASTSYPWDGHAPEAAPAAPAVPAAPAEVAPAPEVAPADEARSKELDAADARSEEVVVVEDAPVVEDGESVETVESTEAGEALSESEVTELTEEETPAADAHDHVAVAELGDAPQAHEAAPVAHEDAPAAPFDAPAPVVSEDVPAAPTHASAPAELADPDQTVLTPAFDHLVASPGVILVFDDGTRHELSAGVTAVVGRNPVVADGEVAVAFLDDTRSMSKTHARVRLDDGIVLVTDADSTNGTAVLYSDGTEQAVQAGQDITVPGGARVKVGDRLISIEVRGE
ncbi:MAG: RDD family protein [Dermabacter sp.]|nr:RDD family protein [Dermabacter sp.]